MEAHTASTIDGLTLASRWQRLGAAMIDNVFILAIASPIVFSLGLVDELADVAGDASTIANMKIAAVAYAVWLGLNAWPLHVRAQSLGKLALGIAIVDDRGQRAPLLRIAVDRTLSVQVLALVPFVGGFIALLDVLMIFRRDRRCLHDHIARTYVVERSATLQALDDAGYDRLGGQFA